jgi:hypothetical protein
MRVLIAVFALVATPFIASVAQERDQSGHRGGDVHAVRHAGVKGQKGQKAHHDDGANCEAEGNQQGENEGCGDPPPTPILPPPPTKLAEIHGLVWHDVAASGIWTPGAGIVNWLIMLNGAAAQTTLTDATGNYAFVGLSAGTYNVCETTRFAWIQTFPTSGGSCTTGFGYTVSLAAGQVVTGLNFGDWN